MLQGDNASLLRKALENLPASLREVLILREIEGMSYREIADITGMPSGISDVELIACAGGAFVRLSQVS